jgi:radical SAM superfamily enzyme YgiQ (UPF0313 family)
MTTHRALSVLLIQPAWHGLGNRKKVKVSEKKIHPLTLGVVAALITRHNPDHCVRIVNQAITPIPWDADCDLVGISVNTFTFPAAVEIAARFRKRGIPVIMGGAHPTLAPDECIGHADAIVSGEAEEVLPELLDDLLAGQLREFYRARTVPDASLIPAPDRSLFARTGGNAAFVQATRGCGNSCRFCYLDSVSWGAFRVRPVQHVVNELAGMSQPIILFVDDNMFTERAYCLELFAAMKWLGKSWWAQAPTTLAEDGQLLQAAADSGCFSLSYGFQTVNSAAIESDRITHNRIADYVGVVRRTQQLGILVDGTFIFGFDGDQPSVFDETVEMILRMGLDTYTLYFLTAYPGTPYFRQMESEGRLLTTDRARMDWDHPAVRPLNMTAEQLEQGVARAYATLDRSLWRRCPAMMLRSIRLMLRSPALARFLVSAGRPVRYQVGY